MPMQGTVTKAATTKTETQYQEKYTGRERKMKHIDQVGQIFVRLIRLRVFVSNLNLS